MSTTGPGSQHDDGEELDDDDGEMLKCNRRIRIYSRIFPTWPPFTNAVLPITYTAGSLEV